MNDFFILMPCEECGSEGRIYRMVYPRWSEPYERDDGPCPACDGTGIAEIEAYPVEVEDLQPLVPA